MTNSKKELIIVTGTSSGVGKSLKDLLIKKNLFDQQVFHSRVSSSEDQENERNKFITGDLENFSHRWYENIDLIEFSTIVFINNAAVIEPIGKFKNMSLELLQQSMAVNILSPTLLSQHLVNHKQNKANLIIFNISSGASSHPVDGWSAYCSTKSAIRMMLDVVCLENEEVSVYHHDPGIVDTKMQQKIRSSDKSQMSNIQYFKNAKLLSAKEAAERIIDQIKLLT